MPASCAAPLASAAARTTVLFEPDPLFIATQKAEGETQVDEIYGEVLVPLFGRFELEIGARYSDFQSGDWQLDAESYKALFNWEATDSIRFRGGWQRANRVPNVAELYAGLSSQVFGWGARGDVCMVDTTLPWGNRSEQSEPRASAGALPRVDLRLGRRSGRDRLRSLGRRITIRSTAARCRIATG